MDCHDARWLIEAVLSDGRGFEDEDERDEYQRAVDHVRNCGCESCDRIKRQLDGVGIAVSIGQA